ncbi:hypothetical protein [Flavobacterium psychrophilum]|uniref:hypothetical protein n=1 Tax=Flavobacterium psychrophilum TaxID=96345 RepID=UPI000B7C15E4|nr:hypothetical protein [Flavobacterium psychrophilum]MCB6089518.1 hypothetical protein [Flavobacterium psychrophilum]MEB3380523.1 hypothetical protein [Flavobacterium psychrophilum]SNA87515.1 hypothetical protein DK095_660003 [Flavobacterium psychrophilum]
MKNYKKLILILITIILFGCNENEPKTINMGIYDIIVPRNWNEIKLKGIDSDVRIILTDKGDTITSDFGVNSEKFEETNKVFSEKQILKYKAMGMDTENLFWSNTPEIDQAQATFLNEYYMYENIDNHTVKFRVSKKSNKGITGISVDSLFKTNNRLTISAKNLNKSEQDLLVNSFYTIKFHKK